MSAIRNAVAVYVPRKKQIQGWSTLGISALDLGYNITEDGTLPRKAFNGYITRHRPVSLVRANYLIEHQDVHLICSIRTSLSLCSKRGGRIGLHASRFWIHSAACVNKSEAMGRESRSIARCWLMAA